jgi:hypothetical protein
MMAVLSIDANRRTQNVLGLEVTAWFLRPKVSLQRGTRRER